ncbi:MAG: YciI family protein, partial [Alphaproteobacteria bacterium]
MLYAMLIFEAEEVLDNHTGQEADASLAAHRKLQEAAKANGHFRQATQLVRTSAATTVRARNGKITITDGPFAETKEMLIGLYVL